MTIYGLNGAFDKNHAMREILSARIARKQSQSIAKKVNSPIPPTEQEKIGLTAH